MNGIENLLRTHRRERDERRRYVAELQLLAERLRADASRVRGQIQGRNDTDEASAGPVIERCRTLERSIAEIESRLAAATVALAAAEQQVSRSERELADRARGTALADRRRARRGRHRAAPPAALGPDAEG